MGKKLTTEEFIKKAKEIHGDKYSYDISKYINRRNNIKIECRKHGVFTQQAGSHINGIGCSKCANVCKLTNHEFIQKAKLIHGDKYDYSLVNYKNATIKVEIICPKHGNFKQNTHDHLSGKGCSICRQSKGEQQITKTLIDNDIEFTPQKRFPECKNKKTLPFDFYLPKYNLCIEFQGRQHYEPVKAFGGDDGFDRSLKNDKIKELFCLDNNIKLIKIKYNEKIELDFII